MRRTASAEWASRRRSRPARPSRRRSGRRPAGRCAGYPSGQSTSPAAERWGDGMVNLFLNGEAMRGGRLHHTVAGHPFLGEVRTAPRYRFYSVRDEFPGLAPAADGADGAGIAGELYDVPLAVI